jgi:4'-phosphopantetheinyl transferase
MFAFQNVASRLVTTASYGQWPADVHLWKVAIPDENAASLLEQDILDVPERERAARYLRHRDRVRFVVTRATLRWLLADRVGASPSALCFASGPYGRPSLADYPDLSFNVSHSGAYALIVISEKRAVGVDIEHIELKTDWRLLGNVVCTEDELVVIEQMAPAQQVPGFFRCWTAKEALLKATGLGIGESLRDLSVDLAAEDVQQPSIRSERVAAVAALRYRWLTVIPGYSACVAFEA